MPNSFQLFQYLWTSSRCEDSISTEENVWPYKEKGKVLDKYRHSLFSSVYVVNSKQGRLEILPKTYCGEGNWRNKLTCIKPLSSKVGD
ncbi:hypothetical protein CsSME_00016269 [Camellia sinensis var. sinensis]